MSHILQYSPGQQVTIVFEILNSDGYRADGYMSSVPQITRLIFPGLTLSSDFPDDMTRIDTGLYYHKFTLPTGAAAVGSYIADIYYFDPDTGNPKQTFYQIIVSAPFGNYSASSV